MTVHEVDREALAYVMTRVERGIKTLHALPDPDRAALRRRGAAWPEIIRSYEEAYGYNEARPARFRPTARDIDEWQEALYWLVWLKKQNDGEREFDLIMARTFGVPWWKLSERFRLSERQLQRRFDGAHVKIWAQFRVSAPS